MFEHTTLKQAQEQAQEISALEQKSSINDEVDFQIAKDELAKRSEELKMANNQAQSEVAYLQRLVDDLKLGLKEAIEASLKDRVRANKIENASFTAAEDWRADMETMEVQYQADISQLQKANKGLELACIAANNARDEAMLAREVAAKQVDSLSFELESARTAVAILSLEQRKFEQALDELAKQKADLTEAHAACHTAAQEGVVLVAEKEAELRKNIAALFQSKQQAELLRWELFESRQNEMKLCEMDNELVLLKEQLTNEEELKQQHREIVKESNAKLQKAYSQIQQAKLAETEAATLLSLVQLEAKENRQRWDMACAEVSDLTGNLESLIEKCRTQQVEILKLQEKELSACNQASNSEAKLSRALEDLSKAIAKEEEWDAALKHQTCLLDDAERESEALRQQIYETALEAEIRAQEALFKIGVEVTEEVLLLQEVLKLAECITLEKRGNLQENSSKLYLVREQAGMSFCREQSIIECASAGLGSSVNCTIGSSETSETEDLPLHEHHFRQALAACQPAALRIAFNAEIAREQLETARAEVEMMKAASLSSDNEVKSMKKEWERVHMGMSAARGEVLLERLAKEAALVENGKLEQEILVEREQSRLAKEAALAANAKLEQLEQKLTQAPKTASDAVKKLHGRSRELSEAWEMVESGSDALIRVKQEEYDALKIQVHEAKESNSQIETEMLALKGLNQKLLAQMDSTNMEIKALRISEQNTWQQYEQAQQGNVLLDAEVQNLRGKCEQLKHWEAMYEAYGSDANMLQNQQQLSLLERELHQNSLPRAIYREFPLSQKEEEEESTEFLTVSTKKKKKALFLRIGTFITRKMN